MCPGAGAGSIGLRLRVGSLELQLGSTGAVVVVVGAATVVGGTLNTSVERCVARSSGAANPASPAASTSAPTVNPQRATDFITPPGRTDRARTGAATQ